MGLTKPNDYTTEQLVFSDIGKALGHPARQRIMMILREEGWVRVTDLTKVLNLNITSVHRHLIILKKAKLITSEYRIHEALLKLDKHGIRELERMAEVLGKSDRN
ncbi:MAG: ArsR/SmtB family transcription factor [Fluviicola sp.]